MRNSLLAVLIALILGCSTNGTIKVEVPPAPSFVELGGSVDGAAQKVRDGREDVRTAKGFTEAGDAKSANAPLASADEKLSGAVDELAQAHQQIEDFKLSLKARDDAMAAKTADCEKKLDKMKKENEKLKDQFARKIRTILGSIAAGLIALGILFCISKMVPALSLFPGIRIGIPMIAAGFVMTFVTVYFGVIVFWTGILIGVVLLGVGGHALIHILNFKPDEKITVKTLIKRNPKPSA